MPRIVVTILMILLSSQLLADEHKSFRIASQKIKGIELCEKVVAAIVEEQNLKPNFRRFDASARAVRFVNDGQMDGDVCRISGIKKDFPNLLQVEPHVTSFYGAVFVNKNIFKGKAETWDDLKANNLVIRIGHLYSDLATKDFDQKKLVRLIKDEQALDFLELGRAPAAVLILHNALDIIRSNPDKYKNIALANPYLEENEVYFYIHKRHQALHSSMNKSAKMQGESGFRQSIFDAFIKPYQPYISELQSRLP